MPVRDSWLIGYHLFSNWCDEVARGLVIFSNSHSTSCGNAAQVQEPGLPAKNRRHFLPSCVGCLRILKCSPSNLRYKKALEGTQMSDLTINKPIQLFNIKDVPDTIYHYCGVNGFHEIVKSKTLWLSGAFTMNDYLEQKWFVAKFKKLIEEGDDDITKKLLNNLESGFHPFILCFSQEGDLLSQWRAYTGDGEGFAIGFSGEHIKGVREKYGLELDAVNYNAEFQDVAISEIAKLFKQFDSRIDGMSETIGILIWNYAIFFKNPGFKEECEWRIADFLDPNTMKLATDNGLIFSTRVSGNRVVPYYAIPFPREAITDIYLGPKNFAREDKRGLELLLKANGYDPNKIKIINSLTSYR
jgi:hypothetical protein